MSGGMGLTHGPAHAAHLLLLPGCLLGVLLAAVLPPTLELPVTLGVVGLPVRLPLPLEVVPPMLLLRLPGRLTLPVLALLPIDGFKTLRVALAIPWQEALQHELKADSGDMPHEVVSVTAGRQCVQLCSSRVQQGRGRSHR